MFLFMLATRNYTPLKQMHYRFNQLCRLILIPYNTNPNTGFLVLTKDFIQI